MNAFDWIIDIALIGIVYRQIKGGQLTLSSVKLPVIILVIAGFNYFDGFSTAGNDLLLTIVVMAVGALFGVVGGLTTKVWRQDDGKIFSRAGVAAATAWILGMGIRDGLDIYSNTHAGAAALVRFSIRHSITSASAWSTAFFLMAVAQVMVRVGVLQYRRIHMERAPVGVAMSEAV